MNDMTIKRPLFWESEGATDVGTVRAQNEDSILSQADIGLWTVADGMGGHGGGDIASQMIVEHLQKITLSPQLSQSVNEIETAIREVNSRLLEYSRSKLAGRTIGSTFVSLLIKGNVGVCLWAGDSRLYRYRHNKLTAISEDHSHVAELVKKGLISAAQAEVHPERNVITRAVGTSPSIDIDITVFDLKIGDQFLLCSDGLYNAVSEAEIIDSLNKQSLKNSVSELIQRALDNHASDNVSLILVKGVNQRG